MLLVDSSYMAQTKRPILKLLVYKMDN